MSSFHGPSVCIVHSIRWSIPARAATGTEHSLALLVDGKIIRINRVYTWGALSGI